MKKYRIRMLLGRDESIFPIVPSIPGRDRKRKNLRFEKFHDYCDCQNIILWQFFSAIRKPPYRGEVCCRRNIGSQTKTGAFATGPELATFVARPSTVEYSDAQGMRCRKAVQGGFGQELQASPRNGNTCLRMRVGGSFTW